jgi:Vitamin K-dependent gamma-carboxylase
VKLRSLREAWNSFFFAEQSPTPLALFRILYGALVAATLFLLRPDWLAWYGPRGWVTIPTVRMLERGVPLGLFAILPQRDAWVEALFWVTLAAAIFLAFGLFTRASSVILFICLASIHERNLYINHGGDTFLRVAGFFLMFAPAGAALSFDRLIRIWRGKEDASLPLRRPWAQRMIQIELALLYFATFCWKVQGDPWIQGSALYYVYHVDELQRFPVPSFLLRPAVLKIGSWFALVLEFSLGVLIWFKDLRYILLALGLVFHLYLEYSINVPMFEWDILSAYILFVYPADLTRFWNWLSACIAPLLGQAITVLYDASSPRQRARANLVAALDVFHRVHIADSHAAPAREPGVSAQIDPSRLAVLTSRGPAQGFNTARALARAIPLLWPLAILPRFRKR